MKNFEIVPYIEIDGIPTFANSEILSIYDRIIGEDKEYVFKDGSIRNREDFLKRMRSEENLLYIIYYKVNLAAVIWLNRFEGKLARINWCTFDGISMRKKIQTARYALEKIMNMEDKNGDYLFDLLIGYTSTINKSAIHFIQMCGGKMCGGIPNLIWNKEKGESEPGVIFYYQRS